MELFQLMAMVLTRQTLPLRMVHFMEKFLMVYQATLMPWVFLTLQMQMLTLVQHQVASLQSTMREATLQ